MLPHISSNSPDGHQPGILVVEDEQIVALELRNRLTKLGYEVTDIVSSGEQALRSMEERRPDLVLMDVVLAGDMTGTQTAQLVRERFDIPVVYLTAYSDPATLEEIKETHGQGFLTKPFQPQELHAVLQLALAWHHRERRRTDAECRAREEDVRQRLKQQLESFTYAAGHDLQEPLRTATFFTELLVRSANPKLDDRERDLLAHAQGGLSRLSTLLQDLIAYAQAGFSDGAPLPNTPANDALGGALVNLRGAIEESHATIVHDGLPVVRVEPLQLLQVFQNLIGNAIKYRDVGQAPEIRVSAEKRDGETIFSIKDNGIGFDSKDAETLFVPFKRLHSQSTHPGTGLGLAICRNIVEAHGGKIWGEATPGAGAAFSLPFPIKAEEIPSDAVGLLCL